MNLSASKIKQIEKNLYELERSLSKLKKYYDYNDIEYKGVRDVKNYLISHLAKIITNQ